MCLDTFMESVAQSVERVYNCLAKDNISNIKIAIWMP